MKFKKAYLPFTIMIVAALVLGGCGKKPEKSAEQPSQTQETQKDQNQESQPTEQPNQSQEKQGSQSEQESQAAKSWTSPPEMKINTAKTYEAEIKTSKGSFKIELFAKDAPKTVNSFVFLSKEGFYNGVTFHRIIESFMVQTGDPTGTGAGGPGYSFEDEKTNYKYEPGIVAMANAGPNTNGSQFFICTGEDSISLNQMPNYTIFGKITDGMNIVKKIAATPVKANPQTGETSKPSEKVTIDSIKIKEK
ncbi:peptidylprolyl isomerase [Paenibacillus sp.]|uniref:peptidylprolyl isomerase n=1 Tax=Paenibacillus sp. TaxID=58172 RepID=UPI002835F9D6|nr:peptidylprolyl isomerase [Paenibacillus sp.]MDR0268534.1 peptidylprolyl isomerase [Paenibacillus sp.]